MIVLLLLVQSIPKVNLCSNTSHTMPHQQPFFHIWESRGGKLNTISTVATKKGNIVRKD